MRKLKVHIFILPRWFGLPAAATGVGLGCVLAGVGGWLVAAAIICGCLLMAWAHVANSWLDWSWTKFDKGAEEERSREKPYTGAQNVIEKYGIAPHIIAANAFAWLALSAGLAAAISLKATPWVWLPWSLAAVSTFWYSQAKKYWHPEVPLCLGFATFGVWLGQSAGGPPDFSLGALASIPLFLVWALAEHIDQAMDYEPNWNRGGRSLGMLVVHLGVGLLWSVTWTIAVTFALQIFLISIGTLSSWTGLSFIAVIPATVSAIMIDTDLRKGVVWGLGGIALYQILFVIGQAVGS